MPLENNVIAVIAKKRMELKKKGIKKEKNKKIKDFWDDQERQ
jgi:hypothetical protein